MRPVILMSAGVSEDAGSFIGRMVYVKAITDAGGSVLVVPPQADDVAIQQLATLADGILLPGGGDLDPLLYGEEAVLENGRVEPVVDAVDMTLATFALQHNVPVLAICRGCQVLNVAAGGTLIQDLPSQGRTRQQHQQKAPRWHASHQVRVEPGTLLAGILAQDCVLVNSFHHQAVRVPGAGMAVVARSADGVVEAIEKPDHRFALGVQWHPECMVEHHPVQGRIFTAFVTAAARCGRVGANGQNVRNA